MTRILIGWNSVLNQNKLFGRALGSQVNTRHFMMDLWHIKKTASAHSCKMANYVTYTEH